jgi:ComF family protein
LKTYGRIRNYLNAFLHLFYPQICFGCGTDQLDKAYPLCKTCIDGLPVTDFFSIKGNPVEKIFWSNSIVSHAGAFLFFTKDSLVQQLMIQLKYHHNQKVGILFGHLLGSALVHQTQFDLIDLLIPIPIRRSKMNQRGYNQSQIIAMGIQVRFNRPILLTVLQKNKRAFMQTHKNRQARLHIRSNPFKLINSDQIKGKHLLLIDDVCTTGATLQAAIACLSEGAPGSISIATAAYTL